MTDRGPLPLLGRTPEVDAVTAALDRSVDGVGTVLVVTGEAGIGKSTLTDAIALIAAARDIQVVHGRCWDGAAAPPHWLWLQVLRSLDVPDALHLLHGRSGAPSVERVGARIADALAAAGRVQPLLVVLDDLHDGGLDSIRVLPLIAARLRSAPVVLVGTYRLGGARAADGVPEVLRALTRTHVHLPLDGLGATDVGAMLGRLGVDASSRLAEQIREATGGNPLLVSVLGRALAQQPAARDDGNGLLDREPPEELRAHVRRQLDPLPPATRALLQQIAVLHPITSLTVVAGAVGDDPARVRERLAPAVADGLLEVDGDMVRFRHDLVGESLYADLDPARRVRLHQAAAHALAVAEPGSGPATAARAQIAHHEFHALDGDAEVLLPELLAAAASARAGGALTEAASLLGHAVGCAELAGAPPHVRGTVLLDLAVLQELIGDRRAATTWEAVVALSRISGEAELLARAAIGSTRSALLLGALSTRQVTTLEEALEALEDRDLSLRAELLGYLATALFWTPERSRSAPLAEEAVRAARQVGSPTALAGALLALHYVARGPEHATARLSMAADAAEAARASTDTDLVGLALSALIVDHREHGDNSGADAAAEELRAWATAGGHVLWLLGVTAHELISALLDGDPAREDAIAERLEQAGAARHELRYFIDFARVMTDLGPLDEASRFMVRGRARRLPQQLSWRARALLDAALEGADGTGAELGAIVTTLQTRRADDSHRLLATVLAAEAAAILEDGPRAAALLRLLEPHADDIAVAGRVGACRGAVRHQLGLLTRTLGRPDEARAHLEQAEATHRRPGFGAHLARTRAALRQLDADRPVGAPATQLVRVGAFWSLRDDRRTLSLANSKGLGYLAHLVGAPHVEVGALALYRLDAGQAVRAGRARREDDLMLDDGGADAVLDAEAKRSYRARLAAIEREQGSPAGPDDPARWGRLEEERVTLERMLAGAVGLGGRDRRLASEAERARTSVTKALRAAIERIRTVDPVLGSHLDRSLRTGARCSYAPEGPALLRSA